MLPTQCNKCGGNLVTAVNNGNVSVKTRQNPDYVDGCPTQKVICVKCGYIEEYALEPQKFV